MSEDRTRIEAEYILRSAICAADPARATVHALATHALERPRRILIIAVGKAADAMARAALHHLSALRDPGTVRALIVQPRGHQSTAGPQDHHDARTRVLMAAHPLPDLSSVAAGDAVVDAITELDEDDAALLLLSGGASSLMARPVDGVTIGDYAHSVDLLMRAGADIHELNTVRRALDALKGGGLATVAAGTRVLALVVSDVPGNPLHVIGSGPVSPSPTDAADAVHVLRRHGVWPQCASSLRDALTQQLHEPPADRFPHVAVEIIADNRTAVNGAAAAATELGYEVIVEDEPLHGEARTAGAAFAQRAVVAMTRGRRGFCMVAGGETVVTVRGDGSGGRNQEFVLSAALSLPVDAPVAIGAVGTDGIDGPTDAAGATCDGTSISPAERAAALDALHRNDAGSYLERLGLRVMTGATGTNVADVAVAVVP